MNPIVQKFLPIFKKILFIAALGILYYLCLGLAYHIFPMARLDVNWGLSLHCHIIAYFAIIIIYGIIFPRPVSFYIAIILQTINSIVFFSSYHPLRSIAMISLAYFFIITPYVIQKLVCIKNKKSEINGTEEGSEPPPQKV